MKRTGKFTCLLHVQHAAHDAIKAPCPAASFARRKLSPRQPRKLLGPPRAGAGTSINRSTLQLCCRFSAEHPVPSGERPRIIATPGPLLLLGVGRPGADRQAFGRSADTSRFHRRLRSVPDGFLNCRIAKVRSITSSARVLLHGIDALNEDAIVRWEELHASPHAT